ncbi:MAG: HdeD family acid-resistance protein [Planctomycetaceae bacterium]
MRITTFTREGDRDITNLVATWSLGVGAVLAVLGFGAVFAPMVAAIALDIAIGSLLVAAGASQVLMSAGTFTWRGFWVTLVCGIVSIVTGVAMLVLREPGVAALGLFLAIMLMVEAAAKLAAVILVRREIPWLWLLFDGLVTAALGTVLFVSPPAEKGVLLGVFIGINLLSTAATLLAAGWSLRQATGTASP